MQCARLVEIDRPGRAQTKGHEMSMPQIRPTELVHADHARKRAWQANDEITESYLAGGATIDDVIAATKAANEAEDWYNDQLHAWHKSQTEEQYGDRPLIDACPDDERWQQGQP